MEKKRDSVSGAAVLEKGLRLLGRIVRDGGKTRFSELSKELCLPPSTAHRLLAILKKQGLIARSGRGRFVGGAELVALAQRANLHDILAVACRPILRELAKKFGQTAHLGVLSEDMVLYLVKQKAGPTPIFTREGMKLEAYCSGIGKVLLADLPTDQLEEYLTGEPFVPLTARTITDQKKLRRELARVRKADFAIDDREVDDNLHCVAVPIRDGRGCAFGAISLSENFQSGTFRGVDKKLAALKKSAKLIEQRVWPSKGRIV